MIIGLNCSIFHGATPRCTHPREQTCTVKELCLVIGSTHAGGIRVTRGGGKIADTREKIAI